MERFVLMKTRLGAKEAQASFHAGIVKDVLAAVSKHSVVVVGMALNPHVKNAKNRLQKENITFEYLEYGGYFSMWKQRLAVKLWSGWPTFPQIFVNGSLVGGDFELKKTIASGELQEWLKEGRHE